MLNIQALSLAERLQSVSVQFSAGQLIGVIGPNGAGKSSLLHSMVGIVQPEAGALQWQQRNLLDLTAAERRKLTAWLPQQAQFFGELRVHELLQLGTVNLGWNKIECEQRINAIAVELDIAPLLVRHYGQLSGGEQRRVHLARSLLTDAELLIFDEPTAGLDIGHQLRLLEDLKQRTRDGQTVVVAIHELGLAAQYCDQLLLLKQGQVLASGHPDQVLSADHLHQAFGIEVEWLCNENGVAMLPRLSR